MKNILAVAIVSFSISSCGDTGKKAEKIFRGEPMKTFCAGRIFIDLPVDYEWPSVIVGMFSEKNTVAQDPVLEVTVTSDETTSAEFSSLVYRRAKELSRGNDGAINVLKLQKKVSETATIFRVQEIDDAYVSELLFLRGKTKIVARLESYRNQFIAAEARLLNFLENTNLVRTGEKKVAAEKFCLGDVEVAGNFRSEKANFLFRNGKGEDFDLAIDTYSPDDKQGLHSRMSGSDSLLNKFDVSPKVLRIRELSVAGMKAQEWLGWIKLDEGREKKGFAFVMESMRTIPAKGHPSLHLEFDTAQPLENGYPTDNFLSDDQAIQRWDSVVASIRSR